MTSIFERSVHSVTAVKKFRRCSFLLYGFLFAMGLHMPRASLQAQDWNLLDDYMAAMWYEQVFDEQDEPIIYTACGKPADDFIFYLTADSNKLFLEFHKKHHELLWVNPGESEQELRVHYRNEQGSASVAVLFFDSVMNYLLFNFQGVEYAFIKEKDLENFRTQDYCPE